MSRRKSNNTIGGQPGQNPADVAMMIRSNRSKIAGQEGGDDNLFQKTKLNAVSSRGLRGNLSPSHGAQYANDAGAGVHLPPMPLTPTEQNRQQKDKGNINKNMGAN